MSEPVAILFWFYRDLPVCRNRIDILRRDNPGRPIFGLYGGDLRETERFRDALGPQLDDFWAFERPVSSKWKWVHGDLMLAAWYEARGRHFAWEHVFVAQWDMLVLRPLSDLLDPLLDDEVLLSSVRPVDDLRPRWTWTEGGHAPAYRAFLESLQTRFGTVEPMSCVFVVACLPRRLFDAYHELPDPELGFVEYRLPTLAVAAGLRLVSRPRFSAWRPSDTSAGPPTRAERLLNGSRRSVLLPAVLRELARPRGARVFHPYHGLYPVNASWAARMPGWATLSAARAGRRAITARTSRHGRAA